VGEQIVGFGISRYSPTHAGISAVLAQVGEIPVGIWADHSGWVFAVAPSFAFMAQDHAGKSGEKGGTHNDHL